MPPRPPGVAGTNSWQTCGRRKRPCFPSPLPLVSATDWPTEELKRRVRDSMPMKGSQEEALLQVTR